MAWQVDAALGLSFQQADVLAENLVMAPRREMAAVPPVAEIVVPDDKRIRLVVRPDRVARYLGSCP